MACCSVLCCVVACGSAWQCAAVCCSVCQCGAVCGGVVQCVPGFPLSVCPSLCLFLPLHLSSPHFSLTFSASLSLSLSLSLSPPFPTPPFSLFAAEKVASQSELGDACDMIEASHAKYR